MRVYDIAQYLDLIGLGSVVDDDALPVLVGLIEERKQCVLDEVCVVEMRYDDRHQRRMPSGAVKPTLTRHRLIDYQGTPVPLCPTPRQ